MNLLEFADMLNLTLEVKLRNHYEDGTDGRWFATFSRAEIKEGIMLRGAFGNGKTPDEALKALAKEYSKVLMVINATSKDKRQEINTPALTYGED